MPSLQIRDLPEDLYQKLVADARREHRTLSQQATVLLFRALALSPSPKQRRQIVLEELSRKPPVEGVEALTLPEVLVREDRDR